MGSAPKKPKRRLRLSLIAAASGLAAVAVLAALVTGFPLGAPDRAAVRRAALDEHCFDCHNSRDREAGLALDVLDPAVAAADVETWEKVIRKLKTGQMPPLDTSPQARERPDPALVNELVASLEREIDGLPGAGRNPGAALLGRLNRAEYGNAIRDLLGIDVDVSMLLPPDNAAYGFDNVSDALGNSPALLQSYLTAARRISAMAVGDPNTPPGSVTYTVRQDLSQDRHLDGLPLGTVGGMSVTHLFPVDGEYEFQVRLYRTNLSAMRGLEDPHQVELSVDGQPVLVAGIGGDEDLIALQTNPTLASDTIEAERLRVQVFVEAGQRDVVATFLGETPALFDTTRLQPFVRDFNPYDAEGPPHIRSIAIDGPFDVVAADSAPSPELFVCRPGSAAEEPGCARSILSAIATRAYRRPVSASELDGVMEFFARGRDGTDFDAGIQLALRRILASPSFVFLPEAQPADLETGTVYALTDYELATRLSLFLWSTIPDDELLALAADNRLHEPDVLAGQVERMLRAPQAMALTRNFAGQWLHLRNLAGIVPNSELFPDFDDNLRDAFRREAELFFASMISEDRSVLDLLDASDTFVNERLAHHYGINGVFGSDFRRVQMTNANRYGLLGKGAVLLATSHPNTTSPVLRGKWVLENLQGISPPPPPADLDTSLKEAAPGAEPVTVREQFEQHRENPVCNECHRFMDPIGFALENFDATGAWRETNDTGFPLDTSAVMFDGTGIDGVSGLREVLVDRPEVFVQTLTEKLMVYALRRGLTFEDMPVVRRVVGRAREADYRMSALVLAIVESEPFRMRVKSAETDPATPGIEGAI